jgi:polyhydroxyalkanoate synthesis repressor PhaR
MRRRCADGIPRPGENALKLLKKYANRRIYDTEVSQFVKLSQIRQMVLDREPFQVVDATSGKDLTRGVLMQIITELESEGHESLLTNRVLEELIRFFDDKLVSMMSPYLEQQILQSLAIQDELRGQFAKAFTQPYAAPDENVRKMIEQYEMLTRAMTGQAPVPPNPQRQNDGEE